MKTRCLLFGLALMLGYATAQATDLSDSTKEPDSEVSKFEERKVSTAPELIAAVSDSRIYRIVVSGDLTGVPTLKLSPGQALIGSESQATIRFADGLEGIQLSENNRIENLQLIAASDKRVIFNETGVSDFGLFELQNLTLTGVVQLLATNRVRAGCVEAHGVQIVASDARPYNIRPKAYGVEVVPGAFTLWNQQPDPSVIITADLTGISAGRPSAPVHGSGILISGGGPQGGRLFVHRLQTGAVYSDAAIREGTADRISGGVFTSYGAFVDIVHTTGPVSTFGPNDMVLDNWGVVDRWISEEKITSHGASGIGFVNFGTINSLKLKAPIETFGQGARGFNVYAGTVVSAEFDRVVTHGNGAVGIQIGQPVGHIAVLRGVETFGETGESLVKGVMTRLSAVAISIKPEGLVRRLEVAGGLVTHGAGIAPLELQGAIESLQLSEGAIALSTQTGSSQ